MCKRSETLKRLYGPDYFSCLGRKGAQTFWNRYYIKPAGTSRFAIFRKSDNRFVNWFAGPVDTESNVPW